ncbi:MAG: choice-of-anchor V domain-containing protein [Bryobacteraceae bacterium]|nr:choice-of-anchor V domain-containing protein [Bryobacteraceae bacterium]
MLRMFYVSLVAATLPAAVFATSLVPEGPPIRRTGAPADGGLTCTVCHRAGATLEGGRVQINASGYTPGVPQTIRVRVEHPQARRFGFQITARLASDPTRKAGTFTPSDLVRVRCDDPTAIRGTASPCAADRTEFASHAPAAVDRGANGRMEFEVEWTPPSTNVGKVVFYASGNAASGGDGNTNDRIYNDVREIDAEDDDCRVTARPSIRAIQNSASGAPGLAWNAIASIFGSNFAVSGRRREARGDGDRYPDELGCVAVFVEDRQVPITYIEDGQINFQAPTLTNILSGNVRVRVVVNRGRSNEQRSDDFLVPLQVYNPALFVFQGTTSIAALNQDFSFLVDPAVLSLPGARAARPGEIVQIFGTGFGPTDPFYQPGERVPPSRQTRVTEAFTVTVGGVTLAPEAISYAGLTPGSISGLYQFNLRLPAATPAGNVPIVIRMAGQSTQANISIPVRP